MLFDTNYFGPLANRCSKYKPIYLFTNHSLFMKNTLIKTLLVFGVLVSASECKKDNNIPALTLRDSSSIAATTVTLPKPDHIVIVVEENKAYSQIIGSNSTPYINTLANDPYSVNFTRSYATTHPSQPNYLDLYSGWKQGVTDDNNPANDPFTTPNLGRQLIDAGKSFATYSQSLPYTGYNGTTWGAYARKHNPAANWMGTGRNQISPQTNKPFSEFPADYSKLPTVSFVIPNLNRDMHDGTIAEADRWLKDNLDGYIQWAKTHNSLFILTFDEDDDKHSNHITTIFCGPMVRAGNDTITINHYRLLRTIEDMYGLPYAGNAANVKPITNCWKK